MKMKCLILICALMALIAPLAGCAASAEEDLDYGQAMEKLNAYTSGGEVKSNVVEHQADSSWVGESTPVDELPSIDNKYPLSVQGNGQINIELFSSTEKSSASGSWMEAEAKAFNAQNVQIDGKNVTVSVRPIASGLALEYITKGTHIPDAYTPANKLWGEMIASAGVPSEMITDRLTGNTAGILMNKKDGTYDKYTEKYGQVTMDGVVKAVLAGDLVLGHTDPNVSSTGLNIYTQELRAFDANNPFSSESLASFRQFQNLIPPASPTTAEMTKVAEKGIMDAMIMESQAFSQGATLNKDDWVFTPAGVRHDSPVYALNNLSADKKEALKRFVQFCQTPEAQESATSFGFNQNNDYPGVENKYTGAELFAALSVWKQNKDGGRPVISVFVVDRSGSMDGAKLNRVKEGLKNSLQYINEENYVGLVSYSSEDDIAVDLPIGQFNAKQRSLFAGAVNDLKADGSTATNSAMVVALKMATETQAQVPNAKIRILVMSDGQQNDGLSLHDVTGMVNGIGLPVYGIGFEANLSDLQKLADINEGYTINADSEDVIYKLRGLFTAEL